MLLLVHNVHSKMCRAITIVFVCIAVLVGGALGTPNGMALHIDGDGHVEVVAPHLKHAHSHAQGADHDHHDYDPEADHGDLHLLISLCSESFVTVQKLEKSSSSLVATQHHNAALVLCFDTPATGLQDLAVMNGLGAPAFRGGTAHPDLACVRSVVLQV